MQGLPGDAHRGEQGFDGSRLCQRQPRLRQQAGRELLLLRGAQRRQLHASASKLCEALKRDALSRGEAAL